MKTSKFLPSDQLECLSDPTWEIIKLHGELHELDVDDVAQSQYELDDTLKIVVAGKLQMSVRFARGEQKIGMIKTRGETINNASFHLGIPKPLSSYAIEPKTRILSIDRETVYGTLLRRRDFAEFLFKDLARQHMVAMYYLQEERELPASLRVARRLHELSIHSCRIEYTQTELAKILGVTRLTVSKALGNLERDGFLQKHYGYIVVNDPAELQRWIAQRVAEVSDIYGGADHQRLH